MIRTQDRIKIGDREGIVSLIVNNRASIVFEDGLTSSVNLDQIPDSAIVFSPIGDFLSAKTAEDFARIIENAKSTVSFTQKKKSGAKKEKAKPTEIEI